MKGGASRYRRPPTIQPPGAVPRFDAATLQRVLPSTTRRNIEGPEKLAARLSIADRIKLAKKAFDNVSGKMKGIGDMLGATQRRRALAKTAKLEARRPLADIIKTNILEPELQNKAVAFNTTRRITPEQKKAQIKQLYSNIFTRANEVYKTQLQNRLASLRSTYASGMISLRDKFFARIRLVSEKARDRIITTTRNTAAVDVKAVSNTYGFRVKQMEYIKTSISTLSKTLIRIGYLTNTLGYGPMLKLLDGLRDQQSKLFLTKLNPELQRIAPNIKNAIDARIKLEQDAPDLKNKSQSLSQRFDEYEATLDALLKADEARKGLASPDYPTFPSKSAAAETKAASSSLTATNANNLLISTQQARARYAMKIGESQGKIPPLKGLSDTAIATLRGRVTGKLDEADSGVASLDGARNLAWKSFLQSLSGRDTAASKLADIKLDLAAVPGKKAVFDLPSRIKQESEARQTRNTDAQKVKDIDTELGDKGGALPGKAEAAGKAKDAAEAVRPGLSDDTKQKLERRNSIVNTEFPAANALKKSKLPLLNILTNFFKNILQPRGEKLSKDAPKATEAKLNAEDSLNSLNKRREDAEKDRVAANNSKLDLGKERLRRYNLFKIFSTRFDISRFIFNRRQELLFGTKLDIEVKMGRMDRLNYDGAILAKRGKAALDINKSAKDLGSGLAAKAVLEPGMTPISNRLSFIAGLLAKLVPKQTKLAETDLPGQRAAQSAVDLARNNKTDLKNGYTNKASDAAIELSKINPELSIKAPDLANKVATRNLAADSIPTLVNTKTPITNALGIVRVVGHKTDSETARLTAIGFHDKADIAETARAKAAGDAAGFSLLRAAAAIRLSGLLGLKTNAGTTLRSNLNGMLSTTDGTVPTTKGALDSADASRTAAAGVVGTKATILGKILSAIDSLRSLISGQRQKTEDAVGPEQAARIQRDADAEVARTRAGELSTLGDAIPGKQEGVAKAGAAAEGARPTPDPNLPKWKERRGSIQTNDLPDISGKRAQAVKQRDGQLGVLQRLASSVKGTLDSLSIKPKEIAAATEAITGLQGRRQDAVDQKSAAAKTKGDKEGDRATDLENFLDSLYKFSASYSIFSARQRLIAVDARARGDALIKAGVPPPISPTAGKAERLLRVDPLASAEMALAKLVGGTAARKLGAQQKINEGTGVALGKAQSKHDRANGQIKEKETDLNGDESGLGCRSRGGACQPPLAKAIPDQQEMRNLCMLKFAESAGVLTKAWGSLPKPPPLKFGMPKPDIPVAAVVPPKNKFILSTEDKLFEILSKPQDPARYAEILAMVEGLRNGARLEATNAGKGVKKASDDLDIYMPDLFSRLKARGEAAGKGPKTKPILAQLAEIRLSLEVDGHKTKSQGADFAASKERGTATKAEELRAAERTKADAYGDAAAKGKGRLSGLLANVSGLSVSFKLSFFNIKLDVFGSLANLKQTLETSWDFFFDTVVKNLEYAVKRLDEIADAMDANDKKKADAEQRVEDAEDAEAKARADALGASRELDEVTTKLDDLGAELPGKQKDAADAEAAADAAHPPRDSSVPEDTVDPGNIRVTFPGNVIKGESIREKIGMYSALLEAALKKKLQEQVDLYNLELKVKGYNERLKRLREDTYTKEDFLNDLEAAKRAAKTALKTNQEKIKEREPESDKNKNNYRVRYIRYSQASAIHRARERLRLKLPVRPDDQLTRIQRLGTGIDFDKHIAELSIQDASRRLTIRMRQKEEFGKVLDELKRRHSAANTKLDLDIPHLEKVTSDLEAQKTLRGEINEKRTRQTAFSIQYKRAASGASQQLTKIVADFDAKKRDIEAKLKARKGAADTISGTLVPQRQRIRDGTDPDSPGRIRAKGEAAKISAGKASTAAAGSEGLRSGTVGKRGQYNESVQGAIKRLAELQENKRDARSRLSFGDAGAPARIKTSLDSAYGSRIEAEMNLGKVGRRRTRVEEDLDTTRAAIPRSQERLNAAEGAEGPARATRDSDADKVTELEDNLNTLGGKRDTTQQESELAFGAAEGIRPVEPDLTQLILRRDAIPGEIEGLSVQRNRLMNDQKALGMYVFTLTTRGIQIELDLSRTSKSRGDAEGANGILLERRRLAGIDLSEKQKARDFFNDIAGPRKTTQMGIYRIYFIRYSQAFVIFDARYKFRADLPTLRPEDLFTRQQRLDPMIGFNRELAITNLKKAGNDFGLASARKDTLNNESLVPIQNRHNDANTKLDIDIPRKVKIDTDLETQRRLRGDLNEKIRTEGLRLSDFKRKGRTSSERLAQIIAGYTQKRNDIDTKLKARKIAEDAIAGLKPQRQRIRDGTDPESPGRIKRKGENADENAVRARRAAGEAEGSRYGSTGRRALYDDAVQRAKKRLAELREEKRKARKRLSFDVDSDIPRLKNALDSADASRRKAEADLDLANQRVKKANNDLETTRGFMPGRRKKKSDAEEAELNARTQRDKDATTVKDLEEDLDGKRAKEPGAKEDAADADADAQAARPRQPDFDGPNAKKKKIGEDIDAIKKQRDDAMAKRRLLMEELMTKTAKRKKDLDDLDAARRSRNEAVDLDADLRRRRREAEEDLNAKRKRNGDIDVQRRRSRFDYNRLLALLALMIMILTRWWPPPPPPWGEWPPDEEPIKPECEGDDCEEKPKEEPDCEADPEQDGCDKDDEDDEQGLGDGYRQGKIDGLRDGSNYGKNEVLSLFGITSEDIEDVMLLKQKLAALTIQLRQKLQELEKEIEGITRQEFCDLLSKELEGDDIPLEEVYPACINPATQVGGQITEEVPDPLNANQSPYDAAYTKSYNEAYQKYFPIGSELGKQLGIGYLKLQGFDKGMYYMYEPMFFMYEPMFFMYNTQAGGKPPQLTALKRALALYRGKKRGKTLTAGRHLLNGIKGKTTSVRSQGLTQGA